jgi:hypothetical protein
MTSLLPYLLPVFRQSSGNTAQTVALSMIVIALLFALLVEKEFIRAYGTVNIRLWLSTIDIFSWTLFGVVVFLILWRFLGFILN